jgi:hypothetical protein
VDWVVTTRLRRTGRRGLPRQQESTPLDVPRIMSPVYARELRLDGYSETRMACILGEVGRFGAAG